MISDPIYKRDSNGNIREWRYQVNGDSWRTHSGIVGGAVVTSGWTVCTPKSQATAEAQAQFEAEAEMKKKLERTYHRSIDTIDTPVIFEPMLAKSYTSTTFPVISQPKLDGIRCVATADGLFTRQGKPITAAPHILEALASFFEIEPDAILDGELYNHDLKDDFNEITSIVRRQKNSAEDLEKAARMIQYHVYDAYHEDLGWGRRMQPFTNWLLTQQGTSPIHAVATSVVTSQEALDNLYGQYLTDGYEGQMVRLEGAYEKKRSKLLLKRKEFQDEEFTIIDIQEGLGNWAGYGKKLVCQLPDGREFGAGVKGNQAFTKELLANKDRYVGKKATIQFFALTPDGVPRFPVAVKFDRIDA